MNKIKMYPYNNLSNVQLIDFIIQQMDKLKILSDIQDYEEYERIAFIVNQLIIEVKRRNLSIKKPLLAKRIFNK